MMTSFQYSPKCAISQQHHRSTRVTFELQLRGRVPKFSRALRAQLSMFAPPVKASFRRLCIATYLCVVWN